MANSSFIKKSKNIIVKEFIKDQQILKAIDSSKFNTSQGEKFINTHIFNYQQNPYTINEIMTFITIQVHIPETRSYYKSNNSDLFISPTIEIWIVSHEQHMKVNNIPKVTENRNDYLSELIDKKFNGRNDFGIGKLLLKANIEGSFQQDYLYRKMVFSCSDLNESLCEDN